MFHSTTWMLRMKEVVNGHLVMVETKQKCYYQYWVFPTDKEDYYNPPGSGHPNEKIIKSGFKYEHAISAFAAGKKAAKNLTTPPHDTTNQ